MSMPLRASLSRFGLSARFAYTHCRYASAGSLPLPRCVFPCFCRPTTPLLRRLCAPPLIAQARRRRRRQRSALPLPTGPYVFAEFRVLEAPPGLALRPSSQKGALHPHTRSKTRRTRFDISALPSLSARLTATPRPLPSPPPAAMALLHRLASDPGIAGVMQARRWRVGLMSEMPPEGKVGVSESCVLGYNVNHGQEISLRLRTDDWQGFRRRVCGAKSPFNPRRRCLPLPPPSPSALPSKSLWFHPLTPPQLAPPPNMRRCHNPSVGMPVSARRSSMSWPTWSSPSTTRGSRC